MILGWAGRGGWVFCCGEGKKGERKNEIGRGKKGGEGRTKLEVGKKGGERDLLPEYMWGVFHFFE